MPAAATNQTTALTLPQPDPFNIEAVKHYVFNQTGNIMMSSTDSKSDSIQQSVRDVFNEVSVFFAAMTKAISQTVNPYGKPNPDGSLPYYSLYNYDALESVIDGSGYFVHVNEEDVSYATSTNSALSITPSAWDDGGIEFTVDNTGSDAVEGVAVQITLATGTVLSTPAYTVAGKS